MWFLYFNRSLDGILLEVDIIGADVGGLMLLPGLGREGVAPPPDGRIVGRSGRGGGRGRLPDMLIAISPSPGAGGGMEFSKSAMTC